jgi:hypothetical protein
VPGETSVARESSPGRPAQVKTPSQQPGPRSPPQGATNFWGKTLITRHSGQPDHTPGRVQPSWRLGAEREKPISTEWQRKNRISSTKPRPRRSKTKKEPRENKTYRRTTGRTRPSLSVRQAADIASLRRSQAWRYRRPRHHLKNSQPTTADQSPEKRPHRNLRYTDLLWASVPLW